MLKTTAELTAVREAAARIAGELTASETVVAPLGHKLLAGIGWRRSGCAERLCGIGLRHIQLGRPDRAQWRWALDHEGHEASGLGREHRRGVATIAGAGGRRGELRDPVCPPPGHR